MSRSKNYTKLKSATSIWRSKSTGHYYAEKKINRKTYSATFKSLYEAKQWRKTFNGVSSIYSTEDESSHATLREVWEVMQVQHFPSLSTSTKSIWNRRYRLLKSLEHLPMDQITPSKITKWVNHWVDHFKSEEYQGSGRGRAGRCNLNNELNLFVTIFNWYKASETFEKEALHLTSPIKRKHRELGFIKPLPDKKMQISIEDALLFFEYLKPLYKDLAMVQFYCAARVGEIAGLQWSNVDIPNRRLLIKTTCVWDDHKVFRELKPFPKNKESRPVYITDELLSILERQKAFMKAGCDFVFHVEGEPLNYGTILSNYKNAQRKSGVPYSGTHILRHGMAKLARKVGGGLDAVVAMTGHKDLKLADHYSKCDEDDQRETSERIMKHIREMKVNNHNFQNVISLTEHKKKSIS